VISITVSVTTAYGLILHLLLRISLKIIKQIIFFICFSLTKLLNGSSDLDLSFDACDVSVAVPELEIDPSDFALTIRSKLELEEVTPMPPVWKEIKIQLINL
jgi:hypothetical protein